MSYIVALHYFKKFYLYVMIHNFGKDELITLTF